MGVPQFLGMVDDGFLELGGVTEAKLCMIAIAYHNKAVDELLLGRVRFLPVPVCVCVPSTM